MPKHSIFCLFWMKLVAGTDNFVAGIACFRLSLAASLNISTEAPDHRNLGANSINENWAILPRMVPIWASSSLEIGRNHGLFMFNPT